ncbi:hypothetical protein [Leucothrix pacifica]|uniref:Uncharacterized protein n=1 Tax=Leucothrix pacifica TaxID=1247513 RepID=A0A317CB40_9GAMM|nr:hypothetical protein [Leucothrix pacifica]PWQ95577.1 hypothetical protein DKW60_14255 [Leucothrix pacifica]
MTYNTLTLNELKVSLFFNDPRHQNVDLQPWVTPRYIGLSYDLPRPVVMEILEIEEGSKFPKRLDRLANKLDITLEELTEKVRAAKADYEENSND